MPPSAGPRIPPAWLTLLWYDTPCTACSRGMTCASNAVWAGRSKPAAIPVTKMTARIGTRPRPPSSAISESAIAHSVMTRPVDTTIVRRSYMSARWPPKSDRESAGIASTSPSQPSASGSLVMS